MGIRVIREDLVDWEPLIIRIVPVRELNGDEARRVTKFFCDWCEAAAEKHPGLWSLAKEWDCRVSVGKIIARCEHFPDEELSRLADELSATFPEIKELRLGQPLNGPATVSEFDWFEVGAGEIELRNQSVAVNAFQISFHPVTLGQFEEFLAATGYVPIPDQIEGTRNYLVDNFKLNFGSSPKHSLYGVTHDDAVAFCNWAHFRLPSEAELKRFFHYACLEHRKFKFVGECWTSTAVSGAKYVAWNGPNSPNRLVEPDNSFRKEFHRHHYDFPDAPCFRVVREVQ